MDRNTAIAFVLMGIVLIGWLFYTAPKPTDTPQKKSQVTKSIDSTAEKQEKKIEVKKETVKVESQETIDSLGIYFKDIPKGSNRIITVENDLFKAELTSSGAKIRKLFLKKFDEYYGDGSTDKVQLINSKLGGDYALELMTTDGKLINTGLFEFEPSTSLTKIDASRKDSTIITYTLNISDSIYIKKIFVIYNNKYGFRTDFEFRNINRIIADGKYTLVWQNGIRFVEQNSADEATFAHGSYYTAEEVFSVEALKIGEKRNTEDAEFKSRLVDWMAIRNKYFAMAIVPLEKQVGEIKIDGTILGRPDHGVYELYNLYFKRNITNAEYQKQSYYLYLGPIEYQTLKELNPALTPLVDFGSFFGLQFLVRPIAEYLLLPLLKFLHSFISNYGLVIIIFSIIIKILLHPLTNQSMKSMKKMQLLQPKMTELREKYKDDPTKMNAETMKLYKVYGINPAGGCLPMLLQMPILIALYGLFRAIVDIRHEPFMLWMKDLSSPDIIYTLPFRLPLFSIDQISGLALLMGITTFIQQKQTITDPKQKAMVYIMPIFLTLLFASFPSGLNLYYFMFNLLSIAQQYWMNKYGKQTELVPVADTGKKGFFQKLIAQAEENAKERRKQLSKKH